MENSLVISSFDRGGYGEAAEEVVFSSSLISFGLGEHDPINNESKKKEIVVA